MTEAALKQTPLHARHVAAGGRMVPFGGWDMPVQYTGILAEHLATRTGVTVFDTAHMGRFILEGVNAAEALDRLVSQDSVRQQDGQCRYGFLLNEQAGILDDLIIYRLQSTRWLIVVNAGTATTDFAWISEHLDRPATLTDITASMAKIDVQGPRSAQVLAHVLNIALDHLPYFRLLTGRYHGSDLIVSRTGYTGELGFEVYTDPDRMGRLWDDLLQAGVTPAGLGARDILRLEAGLPLYGHELDASTTPLEAGLERFASKPADFIGKQALTRQAEQGAPRRLAGFKIMDRQTARHGNRILLDGRDIGQVTSGSFSPSRGHAIGMAYLAADVIREELTFEIDTGRKRLPAEITAMPFYKRTGDIP